MPNAVRYGESAILTFDGPCHSTPWRSLFTCLARERCSFAAHAVITQPMACPGAEKVC